MGFLFGVTMNIKEVKKVAIERLKNVPHTDFNAFRIQYYCVEAVIGGTKYQGVGENGYACVNDLLNQVDNDRRMEENRE
jgi:hypothetical protein